MYELHSLEEASTQLQDISAFQSAFHIAAKSVTITCTLPWHRECIDARYTYLQAIGHRAERSARTAQTYVIWRTARKLRKPVCGNLDNLLKKRWRRFCLRLASRNPLKCILRFAKSRTTPPQQQFLFRALALREHRPERDVAEYFYSLLPCTSAGMPSPSAVIW